MQEEDGFWHSGGKPSHSAKGPAFDAASLQNVEDLNHFFLRPHYVDAANTRLSL